LDAVKGSGDANDLDGGVDMPIMLMLGDMRIIAGEGKGRRLRSPKTSIRPTTALVRGAIFSILYPMLDQEWLGLDLYAGTGALGIEALSRGAAWVDFVEQNRKCCDAINKNLEATGFASQSRVYCISVDRALTMLDRVYDVVLLDPPYDDPSLPTTLDSVFGSPLVSPKSTVVVQCSTRQRLPADFHKFHMIKNRHYGDTSISFYRQEVRS
jgi:16S rRNA (guanine(966)-N(2))-methyltransferase RsmD